LRKLKITDYEGENVGRKGHPFRDCKVERIVEASHKSKFEKLSSLLKNNNDKPHDHHQNKGGFAPPTRNERSTPLIDGKPLF